MLPDNLIRVYLSGSIKKGASDKRAASAYWSLENEQLIHKLIPQVSIFNPSKTDISRQDFFVNYGCDLYLVEMSDVVLVDLREEKGIGVGAEMMYSRLCGIPVVGWIPRDTYYRRESLDDVFGENLSDWIHPFAYGLCDLIADDLSQACQMIVKLWESAALVKDETKSFALAKEAFLSKYPGFRHVY